MKEEEKKVGYFRYLLRKTNEHKFSFGWVERLKVSGHPGRDVGNCVLMLTYCDDKGFRCKRMNIWVSSA